MTDKHTSNPKAVQLKVAARLTFGVCALVCGGSVAAILLWVANPWPDLLLGVLGIGMLLCGVLAIIGRLPSGFELSGLRFEFEVPELRNLISTVRGALDAQPDERDEILRLIKEGTGSKAFREADPQTAMAKNKNVASESKAYDEPRLNEVLDTSEPDQRVTRDAIKLVLEQTFPDGKVQERFTVPTGSAGKRPIFDFYVDSERLAVEFERYWNDSTVDLIARKSTRALEKVTPIDTVIVLAPKGGVAEFRAGIDNDAVIVIAVEELTADVLKQQLVAHRKLVTATSA